MRTLIALLVILTVSSFACAKGYPTDAAYAKVEADIKSEVKKKCGDINNVMARLDCSSNVSDIYRDKGLIRGTREYANTHYKTLSDKPLFAKYLLLKKEEGVARWDAKLPGELNQDMLKIEQDFIKEILTERWKKQKKDPWREWHKLAKDGVIKQ